MYLLVGAPLRMERATTRLEASSVSPHS